MAGAGRVQQAPPVSVEDMMARAAATFVASVDGIRLPERDTEYYVRADELDFTRGSLMVVDKILDGFYTFERPLPADTHFQASAYIFEVARREFGGRYLAGNGENRYVLVIGEPDFQVGVLAMGKVAGRAVNGPEDSIPFFYDGIRPLIERGTSATLT